jgi:NTE family protein
MPPVTSVLATSIHIMQTRIARSRLAGEPADVLLAPRLAQLALMDYHRAPDAIAEGRATVIRMMPAIEHALSA